MARSTFKERVQLKVHEQRHSEKDDVTMMDSYQNMMEF